MSPWGRACRRAALAVACIGGLSAPTVAADGPVRPGLWRIVTTTVTNGATTPPQTSTRCLTADEAADFAKTFSPQFGSVNSVCERTEFESSAERMHWRLQCKGQIDMDVAGDFVFDGPQHYTATVATRAGMAGRQIMSTSAGLEGEYVGECR